MVEFGTALVATRHFDQQKIKIVRTTLVAWRTNEQSHHDAIVVQIIADLGVLVKDTHFLKAQLGVQAQGRLVILTHHQVENLNALPTSVVALLKQRQVLAPNSLDCEAQ